MRTADVRGPGTDDAKARWTCYERNPREEVAITAALDQLKAIVDRLRSPGGCPWDLEQTAASLKAYLLEEAHEVAEAIDRQDPAAICEELGDLLLNVFLQARLGEEQGTFSLEEVARKISEKLVRRHPHVFGTARGTGRSVSPGSAVPGSAAPGSAAPDSDSATAMDSATVRRQWEEIKRAEQPEHATTSRILRHLPASLPALEQAQRLGHMAASVGFDWPDAQGPLSKIDEEIGELRTACAQGDRDALLHEVGDLLLATTSFCRHVEINAEQALRAALARFRRRFAHVEAAIDPTDPPPRATLEDLWQEAKRAEGLSTPPPRPHDLPGCSPSGDAPPGR